MNHSDTTDIVIVGAGPVGLFAIFQAGMLGLKAVVFDALDTAGGQCSALYPEKPIYDIPGYPNIDAQTLIDRLSEQAAPFGPDYRLGRTVVGVEQQVDGRWLVTSSAGDQVIAAAVIIAAGAGAFGPNRPPLIGIEAYEGKSVFYYVTRREQFRDRRVVIAGGGDSAVDWAIALADVAARVMVVHRRDKFRAAPAAAQRLRDLANAGQLDLVIPYQLDGLEGVDGQLHTVIVADLDGGLRRLAADCLLPFFGLATSLGPIADWGLALDQHRLPVNPATMATNRPGIFAIGDVANYAGKLKLILTGFAEAAAAAHAAYGLARPGQALHFEYSTTRGVPEPGARSVGG